MKTSIFFFLFFSSIGSIFAQISINNSHMPNSGDTLRYSIAAIDTSVLSSFLTTGPNQTWNFDTIQAQRQGLAEYVASALTPYGFFVPNRIGEKLGDTISIGGFELYNVYDFHNNTSAGYSTTDRGFTLGVLPFPIAQTFIDKDEIYQFPLNYLDLDSSTFKFQFSNSFAGIFYQSYGYRINHVDAWGSISTPYGTFNCIRVVTDVVRTDTISFGTNNISLPTHFREYKWLSTQLKYPAMIVTGTVLAGTFIPTNLQYRDSVRNVPNVLAPIALFNATRTRARVGDTIDFNNISVSLLPLNSSWTISPSTYQLTNGSNLTSDSINVIFTDTGFYDVQLIASNSQGKDTLFQKDYIYIEPATGLNEMQIENKITLFPNPIKNGEYVHLSSLGSETPTEITIYTADLKLIKKLSYTLTELGIKTEALQLSETGQYFIEIRTKNTRFYKKLLVIK